MITDERVEELKNSNSKRWLNHIEVCDLLEYIDQQKEETERQNIYIKAIDKSFDQSQRLNEEMLKSIAQLEKENAELRHEISLLHHEKD